MPVRHGCYWLFNVYFLTNFLWVFSHLTTFPRLFSQILTGCSHYLFSLIHTGCLSFLIRTTHSPRHLKCEAKGLKHTESKPSYKKILLKTARLINFFKNLYFFCFWGLSYKLQCKLDSEKIKKRYFFMFFHEDFYL